MKIILGIILAFTIWTLGNLAFAHLIIVSKRPPKWLVMDDSPEKPEGEES